MGHLNYLATLLFLAFAILAQGSTNEIVLTNDDGWAVAMIRAQNDALKTAGYDVVLSCPAENKSGTGSSSAPPTVLTSPCEYNTCPVGSPAEGFNTSDPQINYVNSFPVDSVRYGIQTLAPKFFNGSKPAFVVSGPNVGNNLGSFTVSISGTIGAACEAALVGVPSVAFSAATASQISYTTLETNPDSVDSKAAHIYANLTSKFVDTLLAGSTPILPSSISINVNYPATKKCSTVSAFKFVLTRINADRTAVDVNTCGSVHLPDETSVVQGSGCFASVSVFNASTKADVDAATQQFVLEKLGGLLTCHV